MITDATTLRELERVLAAFDLTRCEVTGHLNGRITAHVQNEIRSVGAWGQGATIAEAINSALEEWARNTGAKS